jgi:hypothetical protein
VREFKDFCADSGIKINHASVSHPQSNSQVEHSNDMILQGLKPRIFNKLKPYTRKWVKELPSVLWALRTTPSWAVGHTPFSLVYGSETMLPTEVEHKELPSVLWALRTTPSWAVGHTPFSLVYGSETMLPTEVEHKSFHVRHFNEELSDDS